jgi:hypothetical protein
MMGKTGFTSSTDTYAGIIFGDNTHRNSTYEGTAASDLLSCVLLQDFNMKFPTKLLF